MVRETEEPAAEGEKIVDSEKPAGEEDAGDAKKDSSAAAPEEKEPEEKVTVNFLFFCLFYITQCLVVQIYISSYYAIFLLGVEGWCWFQPSVP